MNELTRETVERLWIEALNGGAPLEVVEEGELELAIELECSAPAWIKEGCR